MFLNDYIVTPDIEEDIDGAEDIVLNYDYTLDSYPRSDTEYVVVKDPPVQEEELEEEELTFSV